MSNQNYEQKDLTLGQILTIAKKALKIGIIYMVVTAILATSILLTMKAFTTSKVYKSSVTFTKSTATALSTMNYNKSNVINKALLDTGHSLEISNEISKNLTITAIVPANTKEDEEFLPTSFNVTLMPSENLNFTAVQYQDLLDSISIEFLNLFALSTFPTESYSYDIESELANFEFLRIVDTISSNIDYYYQTINSVLDIHTSAKDFVNPETGKFLSDITAKLKSLSDSAKSLSQIIVTQRIENINGLEDYIDWTISQKTAEITYYTTLQSQAKSALDAYNATLSSITTGVTDGNVYVFDNTAYLNLYQTLMDLSTKLADATRAKEIAQSYKDNLGAVKTTNPQTIAFVKNKLIEFHNTLSSLIEEYKVNAKAYNDVQFLSSDAKVTNAAHVETSSAINITIIALLDFSLILIAYIVAYVQTYSKLKKQGFFNPEKDN